MLELKVINAQLDTKRSPLVKSIQQGSLQFNENISFNYRDGNISSDYGLLLIREFLDKLGLRKILEDRLDDAADN